MTGSAIKTIIVAVAAEKYFFISKQGILLNDLFLKDPFRVIFKTPFSRCGD
jgi:hypothetical protein